MRPLVSVIIPVFNHAHTIERTLLSLAKQTYQPLEVIIINDGSTDDFLSVMRDIQAKELIKSLHGKVITQANQGAPIARNRGFKESTGQFVIFWDADTVAQPEMIEKMVTVLLVHDEAAYVYSQFRFGWKLMRGVEFDPKLLQKKNYIDVTSLMRRAAFPGFDVALKRFQDWDMWLTMLAQGKKGILLPETLYKKIVGGRVGISRWLPSFMYRAPVKSEAVRDYEKAREIVYKKHQLS